MAAKHHQPGATSRIGRQRRAEGALTFQGRAAEELRRVLFVGEHHAVEMWFVIEAGAVDEELQATGEGNHV